MKCCYHRIVFLLVGISGTLLHFLYEWTGRNRYVAAFAAVNESTWEHMKLLFVPLFAIFCIEFFFCKDLPPQYPAARVVGIVCGLLAIPMLYYTLRGIFGTTPDFVNILIYYVAAAISCFICARLMRRRIWGSVRAQCMAAFVLLGLALLFIHFTYHAPSLPIFLDPRNGSHGVTAIR